MFFDQFGFNFLWGLIEVLIFMRSEPTTGGNMGGNYGTSVKSIGVQTGKPSHVNTSVGKSIYALERILNPHCGLPVCLRS